MKKRDMVMVFVVLLLMFFFAAQMASAQVAVESPVAANMVKMTAPEQGLLGGFSERMMSFILGGSTLVAIAGWLRTHIRSSKKFAKIGEVMHDLHKGAEFVSEGADVVKSFTKWYETGKDEDFQQLKKECTEAKISYGALKEALATQDVPETTEAKS